MAKIHYFQRYSSPENTVTNNTLQLLAKIYAYSATRASQLLTDLTGESIEIGIEINQQVRKGNSVPDAAIIQRSFKILVESKLDTGVCVDQLFRHASGFSGEDQKILLLLTKRPIELSLDTRIKKKLSSENPDIIFKNITYEEICQTISPLFREYEFQIKDIVEDYIEYCNDLGLFDQSHNLLRIVPCGKSMSINKKYGIYFHPADRGYTKHEYVGIYKNKVVQALWKIDSVFDVDYDGKELKKRFIQGRNTNEYDDKIISIINAADEECRYKIATSHRFFCGSPHETKYVKSSAGGIQGARFVNLKKIVGDIDDTAEIAQKLSGMTWE